MALREPAAPSPSLGSPALLRVQSHPAARDKNVAGRTPRPVAAPFLLGPHPKPGSSPGTPPCSLQGPSRELSAAQLILGSCLPKGQVGSGAPTQTQLQRPSLTGPSSQRDSFCLAISFLRRLVTLTRGNVTEQRKERSPGHAQRQGWVCGTQQEP